MSEQNGKVKERQGGILHIPYAIMQSPGISLKAKVLFGAIYTLENASMGQCFASNEHLARIAGLNFNRRFYRILASLEEVKLIERRYDEGHHRDEIKVTWKGQPILQKRKGKRQSTPGRNVQGGTGQNVQGGTGQNVQGDSLDDSQDEKKTSRLFSSLPSAYRTKIASSDDAPAAVVANDPIIQRDIAAREEARRRNGRA